MENIIKKAIEGGWENDAMGGERIHEIVVKNRYVPFRRWSGEKRTLWRKVITIKFKDSELNLPFAESILDPLFWQALGKGCGWKKRCYICKQTESEGHKSICSKAGWNERVDEGGIIYTALRFHEINLTEGWDKAVSYLEGITQIK